jgi:hypothetical protein
MAFDDDVVRAICDYMNADPTEANLTIVQGLTGDRSYTRSELIAFDGEGAVFRAQSPSGEREMRFDWTRPITERAEVREQLFAMLDRAMDGFASR